jgi:hypothetical protein
MVPGCWTLSYTDEKPYGRSQYAQTDYLDPDTDGDGILDGADDVDHDGYTNAFEARRAVYWNHPFNACLPNPVDPPITTCSEHPAPLDRSWPPLDRIMDPSLSTPYLLSDVPPKTASTP